MLVRNGYTIKGLFGYPNVRDQYNTLYVRFFTTGVLYATLL